MTMTTRTLRVGTRASALARIQTQQVTDQLHTPVEIVAVSTAGDRSDAALDQIGGTGVFVSALRDALLRGQIDVANMEEFLNAMEIALGNWRSRPGPNDHHRIVRDVLALKQVHCSRDLAATN